jgi:hypothetical protein
MKVVRDPPWSRPANRALGCGFTLTLLHASDIKRERPTSKTMSGYTEGALSLSPSCASARVGNTAGRAH